jgi:hypothetical protein
LSNAILYRMAAGIPGAITRAGQAKSVEGINLDTTNYPQSYGVPVAIDATSKAIRKIMTGDTAASIYGLYVRPYPTQGGANDPLGSATPPTSGIANVMRSGYMTVQLNGATASAKGGTVYVRVAAAATGKPIGGIEAAADSTNTIIMANAIFMGPADANGNVEVSYNI